MTGRWIVIRFGLPEQETLHICFVLFRSFLCKNHGIFSTNQKELKNKVNEKIRNGSNAHVCTFRLDLCG